MLYTDEQLQLALDKLKEPNSNSSVNSISKLYGISEPTLRRYKRNNITNAQNRKRGGASKHITDGQERTLVEWIRCMQLLHTPVSRNQIKKIVLSFNSEKKIELTSKWWRRFESDHPDITWKVSESLEKIRIDSTTPSAIYQFFEKLKQKVEERKYQLIWNMDETGINGANSCT